MSLTRPLLNQGLAIPSLPSGVAQSSAPRRPPQQPPPQGSLTNTDSQLFKSRIPLRNVAGGNNTPSLLISQYQNITGRAGRGGILDFLNNSAYSTATAEKQKGAGARENGDALEMKGKLAPTGVHAAAMAGPRAEEEEEQDKLGPASTKGPSYLIQMLAHSRRTRQLLGQLPPLRVEEIDRSDSEPEEPRVEREIGWNRQEQFYRQVRSDNSKCHVTTEEKVVEKEEARERDIEDCVIPGSWIPTAENTPDLAFMTAPLPVIPLEAILEDVPRVRSESPEILQLQKSMDEARKRKEEKLKARSLEIELDKSIASDHIKEVEVVSLVLGHTEVDEHQWKRNSVELEEQVAALAAAGPSQTLDSREEYPFPRSPDGVDPKASEPAGSGPIWLGGDRFSMTEILRAEIADFNTHNMEPKQEILLQSEGSGGNDESLTGQGKITNFGDVRRAIVLNDSSHLLQREATTENASDSKEQWTCSKSAASSPPSVITKGPVTPLDMFKTAQKSICMSTSPKHHSSRFEKDIAEIRANQYQSLDESPSFTPSAPVDDAPISMMTDHVQPKKGGKAGNSGTETKDSQAQTANSKKTTRSTHASPLILLRSAQSALRAVPKTLASASSSVSFPPKGTGHDQKTKSAHENVESSHDKGPKINMSQRKSPDVSKLEKAPPPPPPPRMEYKKLVVRRKLGHGKMKQLTEASASLRSKIEGSKAKPTPHSARKDFKSTFGLWSKKRAEEKSAAKEGAPTSLPGPADAKSKKNVGNAPDRHFKSPEIPNRKGSLRRERRHVGASPKLSMVVQGLSGPKDEIKKTVSCTAKVFSASNQSLPLSTFPQPRGIFDIDNETDNEDIIEQSGDEDDEEEVKVLSEAEWLANPQIKTAAKMSMERPQQGIAIVHVRGRSRNGSDGSGSQAPSSNPALPVMMTSKLLIKAADAVEDLKQGERRASYLSITRALDMKPSDGHPSPPKSALSPPTRVITMSAFASTTPDKAAVPAPMKQCLPPRIEPSGTKAAASKLPVRVQKPTMTVVKKPLAPAPTSEEITPVTVQKTTTVVVEKPLAPPAPKLLATPETPKHHKRVDSLIDDKNSPPYSNTDHASSTGNLSLTKASTNIFDSIKKRYRRREDGGLLEDGGGSGDAASMMTFDTARTGSKRDRMKRFFSRVGEIGR